MASDINVLALVKGNERYVFLFPDDRSSDVLRKLGEFADNPDLGFTWYDASVLSMKIRKLSDNRRDTLPTNRIILPME